MKALNTPQIRKCILILCLIPLLISGCGKIDFFPHKKETGHGKQTKTYSSEVLIKWLDMQLEMLRVPLAPGAASQGADRSMAYCGIAAYESVLPGMPANRSLSGQLTDFPQMPSAENGKVYHWAASANAALAEMNRKLFPAASDANKAKITTLENNLNSLYTGEVDEKTLQRSIAFGKEVATRVFAWAATDGSANSNPPYIPLVGPGLWIPTATTPPANPYADQRRLLVPGVKAGTEILPPPVYSTDPASPFYAMVKDVYDRSQTLSSKQIDMALYHRDAPGYPGGGHFVAILSQVFTKAQATLDMGALAYVKVGLASHDAGTICFIEKYKIKLVRPLHYIRDVMGFTDWSPVIPTPNHPEFPSAHAVNSAAVAEMLTNVFGSNFKFTLNTYDYLNFAPRSYNSFYEMASEMAESRIYAGIHYQASCDKGAALGKTAAQNILKQLKFLK